MPKRYPREFRRAVCERLVAGEKVSLALQRGRGFRGHALFVEAPGPDRRRPAEGVKSFEADELAQAHKTIAELEAELEITRAAVALFNGEEPVSPKGGARLPKA